MGPRKSTRCHILLARKCIREDASVSGNVVKLMPQIHFLSKRISNGAKYQRVYILLQIPLKDELVSTGTSIRFHCPGNVDIEFGSVCTLEGDWTFSPVCKSHSNTMKTTLIVTSTLLFFIFLLSLVYLQILLHSPLSLMHPMQNFKPLQPEFFEV